MAVQFTQYVVVVFSIIVSGTDGLKEVEVTVPAAVRVGETLTLVCKFDLEGEPLYTVKWYKGAKEFYRFIPKELPSTKIFPLPGINVDISKSSPNEVVLRNVQPEVTGRYKCEVSSDAPNFDTKMSSGYMYVIETPLDDPSMIIDKNFVDIGDYVSGNCTSLPSYPSTNVTWFLNGKRVQDSFQKKLEVIPEFYSSKRKYYVTTSGIDFQITESTLQNGKAVLSCVANLFNIYRGERKEILEEAKPRPRPSSVLGPRDDRSGTRKSKRSIASFMVTLMFMSWYR
ncbi:hypothetical protein ABEB36_005859 [Hypothenemus hampei]|uniref:Ig-like domain-containing protein n=1 Tax=Hypothenemus hampei TaxID=57062 RepID=A0ABD1EZS8_HYPHA